MTDQTLTASPTTTRRKARNGVSIAAPPQRTLNAGSKGSGRAFSIVSWIVLLVFAILWLIPSLWAIKTSLTDNGVSAEGALAILQNWHLTLGSYATLLGTGDLWNWYLSSFVTSILTVLFAVGFSAMAAYALSRLEFRGKRTVFLIFLAGILIPGTVLIVPIFQMLNVMRVLNTYWAVILPQIPAVINVFVFKQFFDGIPRDFEESARIDGAGYWTTFTSIILPLSRPVLAAMSIITFVGTWNNLILPLFVVTNPQLMTIPVGLATVQGSFGQRLSDVQASSILGALPLVILFVIFQRQIVEGVAGSGLKG